MYSTVIFDLDGTLLDTLQDLADAANFVCAQKGWPTHPTEAYKQFVGNGIPKLCQRFSPPEHRSDAELADTLAAFNARYAAHKQDATAPYPGIVTLLAQLNAAGVCLGVLSNKEDSLAKAVVEHYFGAALPFVQGALPTVPVKPDPAGVHALLKRIGREPKGCLFVGDSNVDMLTAANAGLPGCGVTWGFRSAQELTGAGATVLAHSAEELRGIILNV